ncbi:MAG: hypothetical protein A3I89_02205 [Candidatus Harrisonbacteria bacterium RIFCSPLOWO2_02_FULL_41_11]|uniref:DUF218 domain-containing protein n=1 Tax=Candidatus Harrisonbacteria bacterium RIFCSPHIGHO2_02_FULL_42_16 TaxID=1798404 RepID=A0A1G1ZJ91_9BACT|nr:MAG: hypothetical protein A3B92_00130 [Candidatus Harrisonbacteria bacterium RIFCSPHIGHO2_02_FULL_42_16]OGY67547.1 MAG: hypothetical protein A3I89_02205 [Candidatus Harrisonbacteria bacterium RIFCSPLOWO2_02_FULL_41_11]
MSFFKKLCRILFVFNIPPASEEELQTADVIVTQAAGRKVDGTPTPANFVLARIAHKLQEKYRLPLLVQEEVKMADPELVTEFVAINASFIGLSTPSWNTFEVAKVQIEYCKRKGYKKGIVIPAVPDHMGRAVWSYQTLGLETLPISMPEDINYFVLENIQWFDRTWLRFRIRETLTRLLFWYWGYI